jgi:hypothetical protein
MDNLNPLWQGGLNRHGVGMDAVDVFEQIREATQTIRKLPRVAVRNRFCNWPDFIRDYHAAYDPTKPDHHKTASDPFIPPTPKQLSELDEVIRWLAWLTTHPAWGQKYSRVIWAKACGVPFTIYSKRVRRGKSTCREWFRLGLHAIAYHTDPVSTQHKDSSGACVQNRA